MRGTYKAAGCQQRRTLKTPVGVIDSSCKTSLFGQDHYYLTFYCVLRSLSTHKSDPDPSAKSYHSPELKGGMAMNSKDLEEIVEQWLVSRGPSNLHK